MEAFSIHWENKMGILKMCHLSLSRDNGNANLSLDRFENLMYRYI